MGEKEAGLLDCPFCGHKAEIGTEKIDNPRMISAYTQRYHVICWNCSISTLNYNDKDFAIKAWNKRV